MIIPRERIFTQDVSDIEDLLCVYCKNFLYEPLMCEDCEKMYC